MTVLLVVGIFVLLMFMGTPMFTVLGLTTVSYCFFNDVTMSAFPYRMVSNINNFTLLAIPFFMIAGEIMSEGDLTGRLVGLCRALIGWVRGGLAYVGVTLNIILAGMSGSANADTAASASILLPAMDKEGYDRSWSGALLAASGTMGPIIPPSIGLVVYASIAIVPVGELFKAGVIPGLLMAVTFFALVGIYAKRHNLPREKRATRKEIWYAFKKSILSLIMPIIILVSIFTGFATATEGAVIALVYAFIVTKFIYKTMTFKKLIDIIIKVMLNNGAMMCICATASIFGWLMSFEQIPQILKEAFLSLTNNKYVFLLMVNILLLFLGCLMEGNAIKFVLVPILLPLLKSYDISLIQFGIMLELNLMVGLITPPVGMSLFLITKITEEPVGRLVKQLLPFMVAIFIVVLLVTYIPAISLWLPSILTA